MPKNGEVIVSLTSIPPRFDALAGRLDAILRQGADRVCLTIPNSYLRFPGWDGRLPALPEGVTLLRAEDRGPASKMLSVFRRHPQADVLIADDDCLYGPGWLDAFRAARAQHPRAAIAASRFESARLGLPGGRAIFQGFAGVMLRPAWLGADLPEPQEPEIWADDIWLSALAARAGLEIVGCPPARAAVSAGPAGAALQDTVIGGQDRAALNRRTAAKFYAWFAGASRLR